MGLEPFGPVAAVSVGYDAFPSPGGSRVDIVRDAGDAAVESPWRSVLVFIGIYRLIADDRCLRGFPALGGLTRMRGGRR